MHHRAWLIVSTLFVGSCLLPPLPSPTPREPVPPPEQNRQPAAKEPAPRRDGRLPSLAVPLRYKLELDIDPRQPRFSGKTTISVFVTQPTNYLVLHGRDLFMQSVTVQYGSESFEGDPHVRTARGGTADEILLHFSRSLPQGAVDLRIAYDAPFDSDNMTRGLFRVKEGQDWYAFTQFEPTYARRMFPCFDEPGFKTPFDVSVRVPPEMTAFSNMPEISRTRTEESLQFRFATTPALPTYLVALAVGGFDVDEGARLPVPIRLIRPRGKTGMARLPLDAAEQLTGVLADYFAYPYPFPKLDLVAVPAPFRGAMENAGFITFADSWFLLEKDAASVSAKRALFEVLAHEIAHQWVGDLVTLRWWDDSWLNEGFATFVEARAVDRWRASFGAKLGQARRIQHTIDSDALGLLPAVRQRVVTVDDAERAIHSDAAYMKGAAFLAMVERLLGEEAFQRGLQEYIREHAWKSVTTDDFVASMEKTSGRGLTSLARTFLQQPGVPVVDVEEKCSNGRFDSIIVRQEPLWLGTSDRTEPSGPWRIPFCVTAQSVLPSLCEDVTSQRAIVAFQTSIASCPSWIDLNPHLAGYYRYTVTTKELELARPLASRLAPEATLGILTNAWTSVARRHLTPDAILRLLPAFDGEANHEVLQEIGSILSSTADFIDDRSEASFKAYCRARMAPRKPWFGLAGSVRREVAKNRDHAEDDNVVLGRRAVMEILGAAGDEDTRTYARNIVLQWLKDPAAHIDPDIGDVVLAISAMEMNVSLFDRFVSEIVHPTAPRNRAFVLSAIAHTEDPVLLRRALDLLLTLDLSSREVSGVLWTATSHRRNRTIVYDWITSEWDRIRAKWEDKALWPVLQLASLACSDHDRERLEALFAALDIERWKWLKDQFRRAIECRDTQDYGRAATIEYFRTTAPKAR